MTQITLKDLEISSENKKRGQIYEATRFIPLKQFFKKIEREITEKQVLVDFGSGKGRVLLMAALNRFEVVRGVEFSRELCAIAQKNWDIISHNKKLKNQFEIIQSDVIDYEIKSDENFFFMFNPFDDVVLKKVLENINASLVRSPRNAYLVYNNPVYSKTIENWSRFIKWKEIVTLGIVFAVYKYESDENL